MKISTVINTLNEEKNIERCLASVKDFSGEIILVDMHSEDKTVEIAKKYGQKFFFMNKPDSLNRPEISLLLKQPGIGYC